LYLDCRSLASPERIGREAAGRLCGLAQNPRFPVKRSVCFKKPPDFGLVAQKHFCELPGVL